MRLCLAPNTSNQRGGKIVGLPQPHWKFFTSIRSLPAWSSRKNKMKRRSGKEEVAPLFTVYLRKEVKGLAS